MKESKTFFVTCPKGIEELLGREIESLGGHAAKQSVAGVRFEGSLATAYRVCLWSRLANRVFMPLCRCKAVTPDDLYDGARSMVRWDDHLEAGGSFAVDFSGAGSNRFHSHYAALRVKDAIVDQFRERFDKRPSVDRLHPDIRVNVVARNNQATFSLDLSGQSLHKRGYRLETGLAPLKENLAAAVLLRAGWPDLFGPGAPLVDPMCGSGSFLIEGAMMAFDMAPGLGRTYFGFSGWKGHDSAEWNKILKEARERAEEGLSKAGVRFFGFDSDKAGIKEAKANAVRAGVAEYVRFEKRDIRALVAPEGHGAGLLIANPPYGQRMGEIQDLESLYQTLGEQLKQRFPGWRAAVLTGNPDLAKHMGIRARKYYKFYNGALPCRLLNFDVEEARYMHRPSRDSQETGVARGAKADQGAEMFANRLRKNLKRLRKWVQKEGIQCYRIYDADMPEYAVAVDIYNDWVHVQEYEAPVHVGQENAARRLRQVMSVLPKVLEVPKEKVVLKVRKRTRGKEQYNRFDTSGRFFEVKEDRLRFLVNVADYLDTGLFLDQRLVRRRLRDESGGKRMLNLFCYTATATVYAAAGGAVNTTSVDLSRHYLAWAEKNLELNGFRGRKHELVQADCLEWVMNSRKQYDLIFLSPPTFSNSKRMPSSFDVQRDHAALIHQVLGLLSPRGVLVFSCNRRRFRLDVQSLGGALVRDISRETLPLDFGRSPRAHHCFEIRK